MSRTNLYILVCFASVVLVASELAAQSTTSDAILEDLPNASERTSRGLENLNRIDGEAGRNVIESLKDISPDLARYTIEYPFADVYARPGLNLRSREIATIAALTAMGNAEPQLKVHIQAGLNVGLSEEEIKEVIIQISVYAGFPAALNGMSAAEEVFAENRSTHEDQ